MRLSICKLRTGDAWTVGISEECVGGTASDEGHPETAVLRRQSEMQPAVPLRSTQTEHAERTAGQPPYRKLHMISFSTFYRVATISG